MNTEKITIHQSWRPGKYYYKLTAKRETLSRIYDEVEKLKGVLENPDLSDITGLLSANGLSTKNAERAAKAFISKLSSASDEQKKLAAIGLWCATQIDRPAAFGQVIKEFMIGRSKTLEGLLRPKDESKADHAASCINYMYIIKHLAERFGINGEVKMQKYYGPTGHRYFVSSNGLVVDPMWGIFEGIVFSQEEYEQKFPQHLAAPCQPNLKHRFPGKQ